MSLVDGLRGKSQLIAGVLGVLMPQLAFSAHWKMSPLLTLGETYSDNITLSSNSTAKESAWVTQVDPGLAITGKGKELDLSFNYNMEGLLYAGHSDRNDAYHQLASHAKATLIPQFLFLDASATMMQEVLNPSDKISANSIALVGSRQNVKTLSVSPYISTRLTKSVESEIRATYDHVFYSDSSGLSSRSHGASLKFGSTPGNGPWSWGLRLESKDINYDENGTGTSINDEYDRTGSLDLGYQLTPRLRLTAQPGYEEHKFDYPILSQEQNDNFWRAGFVWTPSMRTRVAMGNGRRYFGRTWYLNVVQKGRRNTLEMSYNENLSSLRDLQLTLTPSQNGVPPDLTLPVNEIYIDRHGSIKWSITGRKTTAAFAVGQSKLDYQISATTETIRTMTITLGDKLTALSDIALNINRQQIKRDVGNDGFNIVSLDWNNQLGRHASSTIELLHSHRITDIASTSNDYTENQLTAKLTMIW